MKTDDWIALLAAGAGPAPRHAVGRRLAAALALGVSAALTMALLWPWRGQQPTALGTALAVKVAYVAAVALAAAMLVNQLARPIARPRRGLRVLAGAVLAMLAAAAIAIVRLPAGERLAMLVAGSGPVCAWTTAALSLPMMAAGLWAVRGLAPTRPAQAGAAVGLLAGAVGALGYALLCPESTTVFIALWYSLAMAVPALIGALLGTRLLRW